MITESLMTATKNVGLQINEERANVCSERISIAKKLL